MGTTDVDGLSREDLVAIILRQAREMETVREENRRILALLEEARRAGKRQAGPFSKGPPKSAPKPPGRKPGEAHGPSHCRVVPEAADETHEAPLPADCPDCGCEVEPEGLRDAKRRTNPRARKEDATTSVAWGASKKSWRSRSPHLGGG